MNNNNSFSPDGYDVLIYMSDQHTADVAGFMGDEIVRTPNLDRIARESFVFDNAYTSCPLCVPARASFMTGRLASNLGVFNNDSDFCSSEITFAHTHALKGYDSNLIGRMHFVGLDHFHGFTRRIGPDMTASYWGFPSEVREDLGDFRRPLYQKHCLEVIGSGDSPVLSYDRLIVDEALKFYEKDYDKPQMTIVGTYAPHFPYVADNERMNHYRDYFARTYKEEVRHFNLLPVDKKVQRTTKEDIIELRAAYYAMVETMDEQIGMVYDAYRTYLNRNHRKGIFIYMSDHGDQLGCMGIYGKQTFFEKSARIPLIMKIDGFDGGRIPEAVSIMDVAPTLCAINGTEEIPLAEGTSFDNLLQGDRDHGRYVVSEYYDSQISESQKAYMVFQDGWKYITYDGYEGQDMLFDLRTSREETENLASCYSQKAKEMRTLLFDTSYVSDKTEMYLKKKKNYALLGKVGACQRHLNIYTYVNPESSRFIDEKCKRPEREW